MLILIDIFAFILIGGTILSRVLFDDWWIRMWDFPRVQIIVCGLLTLAAHLVFREFSGIYNIALASILGVAMLWHLYFISFYLPFATKQVKDCVQSDASKQVKILMSNVLQTNHNYPALLAHIEAHNPDIILTLETNHDWQEALSVLHNDYPYREAIPLENLYGMHLYSKLELRETEVKYLVDDETPSIHTQCILRNGREISLYCAHPAPPAPQESYASTKRDVEILIIGKAAEADGFPTLVCGDLNDVAWSHTTRLFQRISGLLDPRRGRGLYNSFHAQHRLLRWPLDHLFCSSDFRLVSMARLSSIGSDHFPILISLQCEETSDFQQEEQADIADKKEAAETIAKGESQKENTIAEKLG